ncbi:MAG: hypothetical protein HKN34_06150 [Gammaproteobacteria bacterium]|nr:hypothetical protein [Gammaproteobacteria bacterium]
MAPVIYNTEIDSFCALWQRCQQNDPGDNPGAELHHQLLLAYGEPHRVYHTLRHIQSCFRIFQDVVHLAVNADALALAIWFHDAIYDIDAKDNEQRSADWFLKETDGIFDDSLRDLVSSHIMATMHCGEDIKGHDSQIMVDIDLFSFGKPWPEFLRDSENVRAEKADVSDTEFYPKQCGFQKFLLDQPRFFQSDYFYRHYEKQARQNLTRFMALIEQKISGICE